MGEVNKPDTSGAQTAAEAAKDVADSVSTVLKMSNTAIIIKAVFMVATVFFAIWLKVKGNKIKIENARADEARNDQVNHDTAVNQNRTDNTQVRSDSQRVDDFFKGGS